MPTPVFPTAYKVEVQGTLHGQLVENVWYVQGPDPFDLTVANGIAAVFQTNIPAIIAPLSFDLMIDNIVVQNLGGTASGQTSLAITPVEQGGQTQDALPGNVAFCVSLRSALAGRRFRGRKYFSGLGEGDVTANAWGAPQRDALLNAIDDLRAALVTNGTPLSIFSPTGLTLVPVVAAVAVDLYVDSQRRRLTGRGR